MGLFGGFKAKFKAKMTNRSNTQKQTVVCLHYKSFSEFDNPVMVQPISNGDIVIKKEPIRPQSVILPIEEPKKEVKSILKSKSAYELNNPNSLNDTQINTEKPEEATTLYTYETNIEEPSVSKKDETIEKDTRRSTVLDLSYFHHEKNYSASETSDEDDETIVKTRQENFPSTNLSENLYSPPQNNIYFDQYNEEYPESNYQVHTKQYDTNSVESYHQSEENFSEEGSLDFNALGYSSQAASIFFGGADDMPKERSRKLITQDINTMNESPRSSASA